MNKSLGRSHFISVSYIHCELLSSKKALDGKRWLDIGMANSSVDVVTVRGSLFKNSIQEYSRRVFYRGEGRTDCIYVFFRTLFIDFIDRQTGYIYIFLHAMPMQAYGEQQLKIDHDKPWFPLDTYCN